MKQQVNIPTHSRRASQPLHNQNVSQFLYTRILEVKNLFFAVLLRWSVVLNFITFYSPALSAAVGVEYGEHFICLFG
jgi:hypothetical protein